MSNFARLQKILSTFVFGCCLQIAWSTPNNPEFFNDIYPLMIDNCLKCHNERGIAFTFENPETAFAMRTGIVQAVKERRMPPWLAEPGHLNYEDDVSLSREQIALFEAWQRNGYMKGEKRDFESVVPTANLKNFSLSLHVYAKGQSYLPNQERKDDYRCFFVDWPFQETKYITGFRARPGNLKVVHHLVAFKVDAAVRDRFAKFGDEEKGMGYQCFGGAVPDRFGEEENRAQMEANEPGIIEKLEYHSHWLAHWAPGMDGYSFPKGTGIRMERGSAIIVQLHYYSAFAAGESDAHSVMDFQIEERIDYPSFHFPLTHLPWLIAKKNQSMVIPPLGGATFTKRVSLQKVIERAHEMLGVEDSEVLSVTLHSANIHMHAIGASGRVSLIDEHGHKQTLLHIPRWDLDWQRDFTFEQRIAIENADLDKYSLEVECTFANPKAETVYGGFGSDDEMCFNLSYVSLQLDRILDKRIKSAAN